MAELRPVCDACTLRHISKASIVWCTECAEGFCKECQEHHSLSKTSRNHNTIPITEYLKLPADILNISQYCNIHNEKYQNYCKKHESLCCCNCVVESHKTCRDFENLVDVIQTVKMSNAFYEMEHNLAEILENSKTIRETCQDNMKSLSKERAIIEQEIEQTRITINNHLDKLKSNMIKEVYRVEKQENKKIYQLIELLEATENEIVECQMKVSSIKEHASDLQIFLAMKQLEKDVVLKDKLLQSLIDKNTLKKCSMIYHPSSILQNVVSDAQTFGKVLIEKKPNKVVLPRHKGKQAQMTVLKVNSNSIEDISLKLYTTIKQPGFDIRGCCVLPDGKIAFTSYFENNIRIFNKNGSFDCDVNTNCLAFDVDCINKDTLIVTSGYSTYRSITFIDLKDKTTKRRKILESIAYGIAGTDDGLIYYGSRNGIHMINLQNESEHQIVREEMAESCYVATFANNIYQTQPHKNSVTCYDLKGNKQWTFNSDTILTFPVGISVDNNDNVFVVGLHSKNVVVISADGKRHREVLSSKDGYSNQWCLHYDRSSHQLLVANTVAKAFIYNCI